MSEYYFAFGSNMDEVRIKKRITKFSERFGGKLKDMELVFNKKAYGKERIGYANIMPKLGSKVEGIVYKISEQAVLKLDEAEVVPKHYQKSYMYIESDNGKIFKCLTYIANPIQIMEGLKPEKAYLAYLLAGKELLSKDYFENLKNAETID
jgi:cation transport regulator ChaC